MIFKVYSVYLYWDPSKPEKINICVKIKFSVYEIIGFSFDLTVEDVKSNGRFAFAHESQ